jgi:putative (di)nucleoside polyphosphate hydrolase
MQNQRKYRRGVVGIFVREDGKVLLGERLHQAGQWQLPQGGIEEGESVLQGLEREMKEEVGITEFAILKQIPDFIRYDFPPGLFPDTQFAGQEHIYFVLDGSKIQTQALAASEEFARFGWYTPQEAIDKVVYWKKEPYKKAFGILKLQEKVLEKPEFYFDENLRGRARDPEYLNKYIQRMQEEALVLVAPKSRMSLFGEMGVFLRSADRFDEAEEVLKEALVIAQQSKLGLGFEVQQKIRLAHVYQEMKDFELGDELFLECLTLCETNESLAHYLPFTLQHYGKSLFDQGKYQEALNYFERALVLRIKSKASQDQIDSTQLAIQITKKRLR